MATRVGVALRRHRGTDPAPAAPLTGGVDRRRARVEVAYRPDHDGDPDPGEVVWAWVPYEDDPSQGKDRPVVVVGLTGDRLAVVALTSRPHPERRDQVSVGSGPWDREGRTSYARLDRVLALRPDQVRREGSTLERGRFDQLVAALSRRAGWPEVALEIPR